MASQAARVDKETAIRLLGGEPRKRAFRAVAAVLFGGVIVIGGLATSGVAFDVRGLGLLGLILAGFATLLSPLVLLFLAISLIPNRHFKQAVAAVQAGDLSVSWFFYSLNAGMVVVDESGRRLFVNGSIHGFHEVKEVEWSTSGRPAHLRIVLFSGSAPVLTVPLRTSDDASSVGHRLHNALCAASH